MAKPKFNPTAEFTPVTEKKPPVTTSTDPKEKTTGGEEPKPAEKKKRAKVIANSQYPEFKTEFERTKSQYEKHYPGGVEFVEAYGYSELDEAFKGVSPDEDVIMMAHHNKDAMFGVPVSDITMQTLDANPGQTLSSLFSGLEKKGYKGNCYLGICHGEGVAADIQKQGVNIPIFATADRKKWVGANPGNKESFEDFFFGVGGGKDATFGEPIKPQIGEDYKMMFSERQQELMDRRASGTPQTKIEGNPFAIGSSVEFKL